MEIDKGRCEYLRAQAKQKFDRIKPTMIDCAKWALPHRGTWLLSQQPGERNNHHIVDQTHILALRSYVAGFLEGNTSASRPWYRHGTADRERDLFPKNHEWLEILTNRTLRTLSLSNFYDAAGAFYYDYGAVNTASYYIDERGPGELFWHVLLPGSYYVINNSYSEPIVMVREWSMTIMALVDQYGKKKDGKWDWSNFSSRVRKMYETGNYTQMIDVVQIIMENQHYNPDMPMGGANRKWVAITYEIAGEKGPYYQDGMLFSAGPDPGDKDKTLEVKYSKRRPFIVGRSTPGFEYGEKGPTLDALGLIKSLNKKAIGKDQALEHMLKPPMQGPANLKKSYITHAPNSYVPLDANSLAQKGLRTIFEINPAIGAIVGDVQDLRQMVDRLYYADFLLYLSKNPKTRTATETEAIVKEQQLVIGPNLQSLNWTHNIPVIDYVTDYVLDTDPRIPEPPEDLAGEFLRPEIVSVFAQAQKAADLPTIERYVMAMMNVGQVDPRAFDKVNVDKLADLYEDRLYLPAGLNNPTEKAEALREQARAQAERQRQIEQMATMAGAAKDAGLQANQEGVRR